MVWSAVNVSGPQALSPPGPLMMPEYSPRGAAFLPGGGDPKETIRPLGLIYRSPMRHA